MPATPASRKPFHLFAAPGCGSVLVEAMLELAQLPYELEDHPYETLGPANARISAHNPLGQVPTLLLPDGSVMTESAAIAIYLAEQAPQSGLAPAAGDPARPQFLRWLVFLVADVYATYYYADKPHQFVADAGAANQLKDSIREHRKTLWRIVERAIEPAPWFLGQQFSALDVFVSVMTRWTPRREWFETECPKLATIAKALDTDTRLTKVWTRNF